MKYWTKLTTAPTPEGIPAGWPIERITADEKQLSPGPEWQLLDEEEIKAIEAPMKDAVRAISVALAEARWAETRQKFAERTSTVYGQAGRTNG